MAAHSQISGYCCWIKPPERARGFSVPSQNATRLHNAECYSQLYYISQFGACLSLISGDRGLAECRECIQRRGMPQIMMFPDYPSAAGRSSEAESSFSCYEQHAKYRHRELQLGSTSYARLRTALRVAIVVRGATRPPSMLGRLLRFSGPSASILINLGALQGVGSRFNIL